MIEIRKVQISCKRWCYEKSLWGKQS